MDNDQPCKIKIRSTGLLIAQSSKGIISGVVRDPSGAVVQGAKVTATDQQTNVSRTTTSDANGAYRFEGLDPDAYTIHVVKTGFASIDSKNMTVVPSQTTSQDIALTDCADVRDLAQTKVAEISQKIQTLEAMKRTLTVLAETCPGTGPAANCSILESISSDEARHEN